MRSPGKAGGGGGQHQHRDKKGHHHYHHSKHNLGTLQKLLPWVTIGLLSLIALVLLGSALFPGYIFMCPETIKRLPEHCVKLESDPVQHDWVSAVLPFDCFQADQTSPVIAHRVDDVSMTSSSRCSTSARGDAPTGIWFGCWMDGRFSARSGRGDAVSAGDAD
ncbi:hypothetical protein CLOP_g1232 [Closterium sp. NIES-67]|nr:hypothetical protein CLOP_g1232 [Closterium sp. NIES-67]